MRIENGGNPVQPQRQPVEAPQPKEGGPVLPPPIDGELTAVEVQSLERLLGSVAASSQIRESVVAEVKSKLQNGDYLAKQIAVETARSILDL